MKMRHFDSFSVSKRVKNMSAKLSRELSLRVLSDCYGEFSHQNKTWFSVSFTPGLFLDGNYSWSQYYQFWKPYFVLSKSINKFLDFWRDCLTCGISLYFHCQTNTTTLNYDYEGSRKWSKTEKTFVSQGQTLDVAPNHAAWSVIGNTCPMSLSLE